MKPTIIQNSFLAIKLGITYILLTNSVKFFTYLFDPYSFRFVSLIDAKDYTEGSMYRLFILEYSKTLLNQEIVYFSFFILFLIGSMFLLAKTKHSIFSYFFIAILLYLVQRFDLTKFKTPHFFVVIPKNICKGLTYYLLINGLIFLLAGIVFFLVSFRLFPFRMLTEDTNRRKK